MSRSASPRRRRPGRPLAAVVGLLVAACGDGGARPPRARDAVAAPAMSAPAAPAGAADGCVLEGDWTPCAIEDRLARAGVVATRQPGTVTREFLGVPGVRYHVGSADHQLEVFLYPTVEARVRDIARLDSATAAPPGVRVAWPAPPTLVTSQNLAAVILSLNDRTVERLALALGAGLPQPAPR